MTPSNKKAQMIKQLIENKDHRPFKTLLLSATPIINIYQEIYLAMSIISGVKYNPPDDLFKIQTSYDANDTIFGTYDIQINVDNRDVVNFGHMISFYKVNKQLISFFFNHKNLLKNKIS